MPHSFQQNVAVLRRWANQSQSALPNDWLTFARDNNVEALNIERADPELVSLLKGNASAGLTADAIEGKLSAQPVPYEDRMRAQKQARMQQIADDNPYKTGNITQILEVQEGNPELSERLKKEAGIGQPGSIPSDIHQRQAQARAHEARVDAMNRSQSRVRSGWTA